MPLTEQELARLEALAAAATPGPWKQTSLFGGLIEQCEQPKRSVALVNHSDTGDYIVAACHAVPALVAEVRRLAEERDRAREVADGLVEAYKCPLQQKVKEAFKAYDAERESR